MGLISRLIKRIIFKQKPQNKIFSMSRIGYFIAGGVLGFFGTTYFFSNPRYFPANQNPVNYKGITQNRPSYIRPKDQFEKVHEVVDKAAAGKNLKTDYIQDRLKNGIKKVEAEAKDVEEAVFDKSKEVLHRIGDKLKEEKKAASQKIAQTKEDLKAKEAKAKQSLVDKTIHLKNETMAKAARMEQVIEDKFKKMVQRGNAQPQKSQKDAPASQPSATINRIPASQYPHLKTDSATVQLIADPITRSQSVLTPKTKTETKDQKNKPELRQSVQYPHLKTDSATIDLISDPTNYSKGQLEKERLRQAEQRYRASHADLGPNSKLEPISKKVHNETQAALGKLLSPQPGDGTKGYAWTQKGKKGPEVQETAQQGKA